MVFSLQREANFIKSVVEYVQKHGYNDLLGVEKPKSKKAIVPKTVELPKITGADTDEYVANVQKSVQKHKKLYEAFKDVPHVEALIYRYDVWKLLSNISLSVHPKLKQKWGINYELFGAFYNTTHPYNSLFHDLEPGSQGNVHFFTPDKNQIILANPPYTVEWIRWMIRKILDDWIDTATFYVVIPVWDIATREKLGLKKYPDFPEITELIQKSKEHHVKHIPFYDGIGQRTVELKDPVHIMRI